MQDSSFACASMLTTTSSPTSKPSTSLSRFSMLSLETSASSISFSIFTRSTQFWMKSFSRARLKRPAKMWSSHGWIISTSCERQGQLDTSQTHHNGLQDSGNDHNTNWNITKINMSNSPLLNLVYMTAEHVNIELSHRSTFYSAANLEHRKIAIS